MVVLVLALCSLTQPASATDDLMASQLVDQAREWQQKDRDDLAADLWRKVLRANPKHPEALVKLGFIEIRAGNLREAEALYSLATRLPKPPTGLSQLSAALSTAKVKPGNAATPLPKPEPEPSKPAPPRPDALKPAQSKLVPAKPAEPAAKTTLDKRVAPKADAPPPIASEQKVRVPAVSAPPKTDVNAKPAQKTEPDSLNLKFSNSMGIAP